MNNEQIAIALEACDWSGVPIGNKAIIGKAIEALLAARDVQSGEQERDAFEKWAKSDGEIDSDEISRNWVYDEEYDSALTQATWEGWQGRASLSETHLSASEREISADARAIELESALRIALEFIADATITDGQWHWVEEARATLSSTVSMNASGQSIADTAGANEAQQARASGFYAAIGALDDCQANWDTGLPAEYAGQERAIMEGVCDRIRNALSADKDSYVSQSAEPKLDKPAQVSGTVFRAGVKCSTVIGAAQRYYEFMQTPEKEALRIRNAQALITSLSDEKRGAERWRTAVETGELTVGALKRINAAIAKSASQAEKRGASDNDVARALEACDWSGVSIGNKAILQQAISRLSAKPDAKPVGYVIPTMLERMREDGTVLYPTPCGMATMPLYVAPPSQAEKRGEGAVYQIEQHNGSWLDVSSDAYNSTDSDRRRIVYIDAAIKAKGA